MVGMKEYVKCEGGKGFGGKEGKCELDRSNEVGKKLDWNPSFCSSLFKKVQVID
jgi:hypothetical protein